jgi:hypothetical protein
MTARVSMGLALVMVCVLLALPAPALATPPEELTIEADVLATGVLPSQGTFEASGLFTDSGSAAVWYWFSNDFTAHSYVLLESAEGTLLLHSNGIVRWVSDTLMTWDGRWVTLSGTGAYENLHGVGEVHGELDPRTNPTPVHWTWTGTGHFD